MSTAGKSPTQKLEDFLLDYLPFGARQEDHELIAAIVEAARRHIARSLTDDQPPSEEPD